MNNEQRVVSQRQRRGALLVWVVLVALFGCGDEDGAEAPTDDRFAQEVVEFQPGSGAGYGEQDFPEVVLGPPGGGSATAGSLDVLSLGHEGEIILGFGDRRIVEGPGVDFVVFENPFWPASEPDDVYAELGEVSVSEDGETWHRFECDYEPEAPPPYEGCAGWTPTFDYDWTKEGPLNPEATGGDGFDLSEVPIEEARFVRIRDQWGIGEEPTRGFDLDAVGLINFQ